MGRKQLTEAEFRLRVLRFLPPGTPDTAIEAVESDPNNHEYWVFLSVNFYCQHGIGGHTIHGEKLSAIREEMKTIRKKKEIVL